MPTVFLLAVSANFHPTAKRVITKRQLLIFQVMRLLPTARLLLLSEFGGKITYLLVIKPARAMATIKSAPGRIY
jgi:hypothetical protein